MLFNIRKDNMFFEVSVTREPVKNPMPEPKVGNTYRGFDDGKLHLCRIVNWKIDERIDLDGGDADKELIDALEKEMNKCPWVYKETQTIIFRAHGVDDEGKDDASVGQTYFLRNHNDDWFGILSDSWLDCLLDVDSRYYNMMMSETLED